MRDGNGGLVGLVLVSFFGGKGRFRWFKILSSVACRLTDMRKAPKHVNLGKSSEEYLLSLDGYGKKGGFGRCFWRSFHPSHF